MLFRIETNNSKASPGRFIEIPRDGANGVPPASLILWNIGRHLPLASTRRPCPQGNRKKLLIGNKDHDLMGARLSDFVASAPVNASFLLFATEDSIASQATTRFQRCSSHARITSNVQADDCGIPLSLDARRNG
ncbi:uncharacterized protein LOC105685370 isoform X1 [Athalia rosae]|uniref:uncharacterized protein LOC105685370 isoform X1 n=1 Tax=Athalia rosae TaxID=37344 RepID=UPI002033E1C6|nr:uncharacterized protein LOC105685370 isoform X1 [Athalia rosae]